MTESFTVGIICGKLGDVDGVSLETSKWIDALNSAGHTVHTFAGHYPVQLTNVHEDKQHTIPELRFDTQLQKRAETVFFPYINGTHNEYISDKTVGRTMEEIQSVANKASNDIYQRIQGSNIDVLIGENTNALPMSLVSGTTLYQLSVERRIATIFHHHDFWWERSRFSHSRIDDFLQGVMPPNDPSLEHVVISTYSQHVLSVIQRIKPFVIYNYEDFEHVTTKDNYNDQLRADIGLEPDDILVLQPTRIVPRKHIHDSIAFLGKLQKKYPALKGRLKFVISLYQGDEPNDVYLNRIKEQAKILEVPMLMISDQVASVRGVVDGKRMYTNRDVLAQADLVLYLPVWEGFGNALLEAVAARVPIVTSTYLVYKTDIKSAGFKNIEIRDKYDENGNLIIPDSALTYAHHILTHPKAREQMTEHNFELGAREFSLPVLSRRLEDLFQAYSDEIRASQKRQFKQGLYYSV